jgi:hypothetical protein
MRRIVGRTLVAAAALALTLVALGPIGDARATSANTDVTDLWWDPTDGGWGMQLTDTGTFVYGTLFVYGPDRQPTWVAGEMTKTNSSLETKFTGPLYVTTGTYYGGISLKPFTSREAGTMTFTLIDVYTGTLRYTVDGVVVNRTVQRQPLTYDDYSGTYRALMTSTATGCRFPAVNGSSTDQLSIRVVQNGSQMTQTWTYLVNGNVCTYSGTYAQLGRMGTFDARFQCTSGEIGRATLTEMNNVPNMFTARLQVNSTTYGCNSVGEMQGLVPR